MLGTLYVVISSSKEEDYQKVKEELLEIYPDFSVSPYKESQMEILDMKFSSQQRIVIFPFLKKTRL